MQHFGDVLKIIEGGLKFNVQTVVNYAQALKARLEKDGELQQARLLQTKLDGISPTLMAYSGSTAPELPVDQESQLELADIEKLAPGEAHAILDTHIRSDVDRFLTYARATDQLVEAGVGVAPRMLIFGPPGVGKTQLARHLAAELGLPLMTARCDSLISSYLGSTAKNIRKLFDHASERPCVLFLDEFDALAKARDDAQELGELKRVVVGLLQNIDALPPSCVLIAATNHQQLLDAAVWRRFSFRINMDLPRPELRDALLRSYLKSFLPSEHLDRAVLLSEGLSGAALREVAEDCIRGAVIAGEQTVPAHLLLHRMAQTSIIARGMSPTESAIARFLLDNKTPQRLAAAASNMSRRQVIKLSADMKVKVKPVAKEGIRKTGKSGGLVAVDKGTDSGKVQKPGAGRKSSAKRA